MLTLENIAERVDISLTAARQYHNRATRRRREGAALSHDLPEPSAFVGRSPRWSVDVVEAWILGRPGRTGRPKKS